MFLPFWSSTTRSCAAIWVPTKSVNRELLRSGIEVEGAINIGVCHPYFEGPSSKLHRSRQTDASPSICVPSDSQASGSTFCQCSFDELAICVEYRVVNFRSWKSPQFSIRVSLTRLCEAQLRLGRKSEINASR